MEKQTSSVPKSGIKPPEKLKSGIFSFDFGRGVRGVGGGGGGEKKGGLTF